MPRGTDGQQAVGYVLAGELQVKMDKSVHTAQAGDMIYLRVERQMGVFRQPQLVQEILPATARGGTSGS